MPTNFRLLAVVLLALAASSFVSAVTPCKSMADCPSMPFPLEQQCSDGFCIIRSCVAWVPERACSGFDPSKRCLSGACIKRSPVGAACTSDMLAATDIDKPCAEGLQCVANQCVGVDPPKSSSTSTSSSPATSSSTTGSTLSTSTSSTTSSTPTSALNDPLASSTDANPLLYILGAACFILLVTTLGCWARRRPVRILVAGPKPTAAPASRPQPATAPVAAPPPAQLPVSTAQYGSPIVEQVEYVTVGRLAVPEPLQPVAMPQPVRGYPPAVPPPVAVPHPAAGVGGTVPAVMSFALSQTAAAATEPQEVIADPMRLPSTVPRTDGDDLVLPSGR